MAKQRRTLLERVHDRSLSHNAYSQVRAELNRLAWQVRKLKQRNGLFGKMVYIDDVLALIKEAKR